MKDCKKNTNSEGVVVNNKEVIDDGTVTKCAYQYRRRWSPVIVYISVTILLFTTILLFATTLTFVVTRNNNNSATNNNSPITTTSVVMNLDITTLFDSVDDTNIELNNHRYQRRRRIRSSSMKSLSFSSVAELLTTTWNELSSSSSSQKSSNTDTDIEDKKIVRTKASYALASTPIDNNNNDPSWTRESTVSRISTSRNVVTRTKFSDLNLTSISSSTNTSTELQERCTYIEPTKTYMTQFVRDSFLMKLLKFPLGPCTEDYCIAQCNTTTSNCTTTPFYNFTPRVNDNTTLEMCQCISC